jgi:hypothetical protein
METVQVVSGKKYCFSAFIKNVCRSCNQNASPSLNLTVNGVVVAHVDTLMFDSAWAKVCGTWVAPATGPANLAIQLLPTTVNGGFDLGVDDVSFRPTCDSTNNGNGGGGGGGGGGDNGDITGGKSPGATGGNIDRHYPRAGDNVTVSPVPVKKGDVLNISYEATAANPVMMQLFDESGKLVYSSTEKMKQGMNKLKINTTDLAPGKYFIKFETGDEKNSLKKMIVIE